MSLTYLLRLVIKLRPIRQTARELSIYSVLCLNIILIYFRLLNSIFFFPIHSNFVAQLTITGTTYSKNNKLFNKRHLQKKNIHNFLVFVQFLWLTRLVSIFHYVSHKDFITLNSVDLKNCPNFFSGTNFNLTFSNC